MSVALRPERPPNPLLGLLDRLGPVLLTIAVGIVLGLQFILPDKRMIAVIAAILLFGLAWRLDMVAGLGVLAIALPFPRITVFGSTNLAFVALIAVLWLLRASVGQSLRPRSSPLDAPVIALFVAYVVSFYNITSAMALDQALRLSYLHAAAILMFFVVVNNLHDERGFRRLLDFQVVSVLLVCLLAVWELNHPGQYFIPGWIGFQTGVEEVFLRDIRVGSSFQDYELLSEYCALNALLVLFLFLRAETMLRRVAYGALLPLIVFVLFATVTRGSLIALGTGVLYLLWIIRRRVNFVALVIVGTALVAGFQGMAYYVATFTRSGSIITRFGEESGKFVGIMPSARASIWQAAWERTLEHPFIGHGPYYAVMSGTRSYMWPHNLYLFISNNVGLIGLGIFLWMLLTLLWMSRPQTDDLQRADFMHSYMIIAQVQMIVFMIDETKIEFMRNGNYEFQIWLMFALITAAYQIIHPAPARALAPAGGRPGIRR